VRGTPKNKKGLEESLQLQRDQFKYLNSSASDENSTSDKKFSTTIGEKDLLHDSDVSIHNSVGYVEVRRQCTRTYHGAVGVVGYAHTCGRFSG
jgi:hypothetical protein